MDVTNGGRGAADFMLGLEARAASLEEPDLNTAISAACDAYGTDMGRGGEYARQAERMWCDAAAYDWLALCDDPRAVGGWADDTRRLAVVAAVLEHRPAQAMTMILEATLNPDHPSLEDMRARLSDETPPDPGVTLERLLDDPYMFDPCDRMLDANVRAAMSVLGPIGANASTGTAYAVVALRSAMRLARGDTAVAADLASSCIGYGAGDGLAGTVVRRTGPASDGMAGGDVFLPAWPTL